MKTAILFIAVMSCYILVTTEGTSVPDCSQGCDPKYCPELPDCKCGTYKDYCGCCVYCLKCPGEKCNIPAMEKCANGTTCKPRPGADAIERINGPGWCS